MSRVFIFILLLTSCNTNTKITLKGIQFGTTYSVQYFDNEQLDYTNQLDSLFVLVNNSMSTYIDISLGQLKGLNVHILGQVNPVKYILYSM